MIFSPIRGVEDRGKYTAKFSYIHHGKVTVFWDALEDFLVLGTYVPNLPKTDGMAADSLLRLQNNKICKIIIFL